MAATRSALGSAWPGREREIDRLWELLEEPDLALPTFVYGPSGGGKSGVLRAVLQALGARHAILDCVTCSTARSLFESALTQLHRHVPSASNGYTGWAPCDSAPAFVAGLQQAVSEYGRLVLVFDNAAGLGERKEVLTLLLSLHTLCGSAAVSIVFVAEALWPEAHELTAFAPLATVRFGGYSKAQLEAILAVDAPKGCEAAWRDFLPLFVSYSYEICRDLHELRYLCRGAFGEWMRPVHDGLIDAGDKGALLRAGKVCLQEARKRVYAREAPLTRKAEAARAVDGADGGGLALPTSAKWLLLSAYLASRCRPGMDSALFASRQKGAPSSRRAKRARATYDEPHSFTMQRLLAICAALRHAGVGGGQPMAPELTQVASLLRLRLLHRASRAEELDAVRLSCAAPLELVDATARELQFDLEVYLAG